MTQQHMSAGLNANLFHPLPQYEYYK